MAGFLALSFEREVSRAVSAWISKAEYGQGLRLAEKFSKLSKTEVQRLARNSRETCLYPEGYWHSVHLISKDQALTLSENQQSNELACDRFLGDA